MLAPLLVLALLAQTVPEDEPYGPNGPIYSSAAATSAVEPGDAGTLLYSLLVDAGDQSSFSDLCDTYAGGFDGGYWCLRPDGGVTGAAMAINGGVTSETHSVCGNGSHCANETRLRFASTGEVATGNVASPTQDFTTCAVFNGDTLASRYLVSKGATANTFGFYANASGGINLQVYSAGGNNILNSSNALIAARQRNLVCARYRYVADSTSLGSLWHNGASVGTKSDMRGPPAVSSSVFRVHYAISAVTGTVSNAFYTPVYIADAEMAAMADLVLGKLTPSLGGAITFTRGSAQMCPNTAGDELTSVRTNQPCLSAGALQQPLTRINSILRSEEIDHATYTKVSDGVTAIPTVTANTTDVPDPLGGFTAEKVVFPAVAGAGAYSLLRQTFTGGSSTTGYSAAPYMRTLAGTVTLYNALSISTPLYHSTACTITTTWDRCKLEGKTLTAATWNRDIGVNLNDPSQATQAGGTVYVWGDQVEFGRFSSPYMPTTSATAQRANMTTTAPNPLPTAPTKFCMGATISSPWTTSWTAASVPQRSIFNLGTTAAANSASLFINLNSGGLRNYLYDSSASLLGRFTSGNMTSGAHRVTVSNLAGELSTMRVDAADQSLTTTGTGLGFIATQPGTLHIGTDSSTRTIDAAMSQIKIGDGLTVCE